MKITREQSIDSDSTRIIADVNGIDLYQNSAKHIVEQVIIGVKDECQKYFLEKYKDDILGCISLADIIKDVRKKVGDELVTRLLRNDK